MTETDVAADLDDRIARLLLENDPASTDAVTFLGARFDAGLAWVHFPIGFVTVAASRLIASQKAFRC